MGAITDRLDTIARSAADLSPLAEPVRARLWEGNRAAILAGQSPDGSAVAPVKPSTMKRRGGSGPPRAPHGSSSRSVARYVVDVVRSVAGVLTFRGHWPGFEREIQSLNDGSKRMAPRPTFGFRAVDLEWCRAKLREHVLRQR